MTIHYGEPLFFSKSGDADIEYAREQVGQALDALTDAAEQQNKGTSPA
jgi:hypothetical protein